MKSGKAFDLTIFKRLISFAKPYQTRFLIASFSTILLAVISASVPYTMIVTINDFSKTKNSDNLLNYTILLPHKNF